MVNFGSGQGRSAFYTDGIAVVAKRRVVRYVEDFKSTRTPVWAERCFLWWVAAAIAISVLAGIGGFTFIYAEGVSYVSTEPKVCANCHIMQSQLDSWQKSSHLPQTQFSEMLRAQRNPRNSASA